MLPNELFRRQRGHIETLQGQVKNLQATNLNLLFKVVFGKEDLMNTLYPRRTRRTAMSIVTRSKA
jgi:hypothetical protein